jgi:glycosyltransferase involved in cell wall biosynthesis
MCNIVEKGGHPVPYDLSIVIPAFNEKLVLPRALETVKEIVEAENVSYEIIVVDDGSTDNTSGLIDAAHTTTPEIKGIVLSRRFGKEAALFAGLNHSSGKAVVTLDADLQHPPNLIPEMLDHWRKGAEIVHGVKQDRQADTLLQRFTAAVYSTVFSRLSGIDLRGSSDFKLLDRRVVDVLTNSLPEYGRFYRGLSAWVGYRQVEVPFDVAPRESGESRWGGISLIRYAIQTVTAFSSLPLMIVPMLGAVMLVIAIILGTEAVVSKLSGHAVSGFATLEITILFSGSLIMIGLGVIGQYLARIFDEIKGRPVCLISHFIGLDSSPDTLIKNPVHLPVVSEQEP